MPGTGASGWGFREASRLGLTVHEAYPALVPLLHGDEDFGTLSGITVEVTITAGGGSFRGPLLFTHGGFSGPAVMNSSHAWTSNPPGRLLVSWTPIDPEGWRSILDRPRGRIAGILSEFMPSRLASVLPRKAGLEPGASAAEVSRTSRDRLIEVLCAFPLPVTGNAGWDRAEVTGGGVSLDEIDPASLESLALPGLRFAGEVLDAFGPIGGWNLYWAWLTGRCAAEG